MTDILDRIAKSLHSQFRPANPDEYFALRLAQRLGEPEAAAHYAILVSQYPEQKILCAFRKTIECGKPDERAGRLFHDYLDSMTKNGNGSVPRPRLIAARVERRTIAVAVFAGTHLEGRRIIQLSSNSSRAEASAASFVRDVLAETDCTFAAIEPAPTADDILRSILHRATVAEIRTYGLSLWEISIQTLLSAFGHPPLKNRLDLREIMLSIWPVSGLKAAQVCALDAFAIGLFVQTERLFNNF